MAVAGFAGYLMRKRGYSAAAFPFTSVAETAFRQSLVLSKDG